MFKKEIKKQKKIKSTKAEKPKQLQSPKGMHDILPGDQIWWDEMRKISADIAQFYNFSPIETPVLEQVELFERSVGTSTDIVEKEMFTLKTKGGDRLVLRPEGTASIARAYIEHGLSHMPQPLKVWYAEPMFRHESPQAGRFRAFHQTGFEIIGGNIDALFDAQIILSLHRFLEAANIKSLTIQINSIGCKVCRPNYLKKLINYYKDKTKKLCNDCRNRLEANPLRLLDCKKETCVPIKADAPSLLDHLCATCKDHFKSVLEYLDELGIIYTLNPYLVRGLDYYSRTVFEIFSDASPLALAGGGRYDYLIELLGGQPTPGVGGAIGLERVIEAMKAANLKPNVKFKPTIYLVHLGDVAKRKSLKIIEMFRSSGIRVKESLGKDSLKNQLRSADRERANLALILGQKEVYEESIILRDLDSGTQESILISKVVEEVKKRLR